jgi:hypothetical protein
MISDVANNRSSAGNASGPSKCTLPPPGSATCVNTEQITAHPEYDAEDDEVNVDAGAEDCGDEAEPATQVRLGSGDHVFSLMCWLLMHAICLCFLNVFTEVDSS